MSLDLASKYYLPPGDAVELRAFTHGLMPRTVPSMMQHFVDDWRERGVDAWNEVPNHWLPESGDKVGWWNLPEYLGDQFVAPLLGAPAGTCIMQPNVHWAVNCLFSDVGRFRGRRVVLTEDAFPSVLQPARQWATLAGFEVEVVPSAIDGFTDQRAVLNALDRNTAALVLSHVDFSTGARLPDRFLQDAARAVHDAGGLMIVDGYHALGTMPIHVTDLGIDVYLGGLLKEGSGSSGTGILYVRDGLDLTPAITGWFGHADPFAFKAEPLSSPDVRRRFLGGTTAVAPLYHAVEGIRILLEVGLNRIRAYSDEMTSRLVEGAKIAGLTVVTPLDDARRSSMVVLKLDKADLMSHYLKSKGIYTDSRFGSCLRMAPFVWNTMVDLDRALEVIVDALRSGSYLTFRELGDLPPTVT